MRVDSVGRRREGKNHEGNGGLKAGELQNVPQMNPMMMTNMYPQGDAKSIFTI